MAGRRGRRVATGDARTAATDTATTTTTSSTTVVAAAAAATTSTAVLALARLLGLGVEVLLLQCKRFLHLLLAQGRHDAFIMQMTALVVLGVQIDAPPQSIHCRLPFRRQHIRHTYEATVEKRNQPPLAANPLKFIRVVFISLSLSLPLSREHLQTPTASS